MGPARLDARLDRARAERLRPIEGTPPSLINVPAGCAFHPRCRHAGLTSGRCERDVPVLREVGPGHIVACHLSTAQRAGINAEEARVTS